MVHLARQYFFAFFRPLAFGNVLKAIDRADDVPIAIFDCFDVNDRDAARTVRPFDVDFLLAHRKFRTAAPPPWGIHEAGVDCRLGGTFDTIRKTAHWDRRV
jgi:hypothetical protein